MGIPYFKVRLGHKAISLRAMGSSHVALGLENKERIREDRFHSPL